jgi:hypothetical protein
MPKAILLEIFGNSGELYHYHHTKFENILANQKKRSKFIMENSIYNLKFFRIEPNV